MYKRILTIISVLVVVVMVSGCLGSVLACQNCNSQKVTSDKNDKIVCSDCGSPITCPECKGTLDHRKKIDENGNIHDQAVCFSCNKRYDLN